MSKKHNIDELFQKGANKHHFRPKEEDWNAMADQLGSKGTNAIWRWFLPLFILLVAGGGTLIYLQESQSANGIADGFSESSSIWQNTEGQLSVISDRHVESVDNFESEPGVPSRATNSSALSENSEDKPTATGQINQANAENAENLNNNQNRFDHSGNITNSEDANLANTGSTETEHRKGNDDIANRSASQTTLGENGGNVSISEVRKNIGIASHSASSFENSYLGFFEFLPSKKIEFSTQLNHNPVATDTMLQRIFDKKKKPGFRLSVMAQLVGSPEFVSQGGGIQVSLPLDPNFTATSGVGYWWRPISNLEYMSTGNDYGFGKDSVALKLEPEQIHYFTIPLMVTYRPNVRHLVKAGFEGNLLLNTYSTVTRYERPGNLEAKTETWQSWGYNAGFKAVHFNVLLGYEYRLNEFWSLGVNTRFGYTKNLEEELFNKDQLVNRNASILLRYHIW